MEFTIEQRPTMVARTGKDGKKLYYPTWRIDIDGDVIASEYDCATITPDEVNEIVAEAASEISHAIACAIRKHAVMRVRSVHGVCVMASVNLERWDNDYAVAVDEDRFDCALALDSFPLSELPPDADGFNDGFLTWGDEVYSESVHIGLTDDWDGPFTFRIGDGEAYDRYIAARVREEYGYETIGYLE